MQAITIPFLTDCSPDYIASFSGINYDKAVMTAILVPAVSNYTAHCSLCPRELDESEHVLRLYTHRGGHIESVGESLCAVCARLSDCEVIAGLIRIAKAEFQAGQKSWNPALPDASSARWVAIEIQDAAANACRIAKAASGAVLRIPYGTVAKVRVRELFEAPGIA